MYAFKFDALVVLQYDALWIVIFILFCPIWLKYRWKNVMELVAFYIVAPYSYRFRVNLNGYIAERNVSVLRHAV